MVYVLKSLSSFVVGLGGTANTSAISSVETDVMIYGIVVGIIIIIMSLGLLASAKRGARVAGGIIVIIVGLIGSLDTLGGLIIGIILAFVAGILAIVHKDQSKSLQAAAPME